MSVHNIKNAHVTKDVVLSAGLAVGFTSSWHITENMRERPTGEHTAGSQRQLTSGAAETKQLKDYHSKKVLVLT